MVSELLKYTLTNETSSRIDVAVGNTSVSIGAGASVQVSPSDITAAIIQSISLGLLDCSPLVGTLPSDTVGFRTVTGTIDTIRASDVGSKIRYNSASDCVVTVPTVDAATPIAVGAYVVLHRANTGAVTITPAAGVTINFVLSRTKLSYTHSEACINYIGNNVWDITGELSA